MVVPQVDIVVDAPVSGQKRSAPDGSKVSEPAQKKKTTAKARAPAPQGRKAPVKANNAPSTVMSSGQAALKLRKEQQALQQNQAGRAVKSTPNPLSAVTGSPGTVKTGIKATGISSGASPSTSGANTRPVATTKGDSITSDAAAAVAAAVSSTAPLPVVITGTPTEADFKSVAQAAVTNLILNVGTSNPEGVLSLNVDDKVDTSTAHIKALTSSNWVAACSGGSVGDNDDTSVSAADSKANRARRQNLTPDERARQNRDRNREHARNTRLRKKAYVEELKRTLTELVAQRDAAELEKRHAAQRELEQREVRFRVMEEFLKLRGRNESNYGRWGAILEDAFTFTLPITDYRKVIEKDEGKLDVFPPKTEQVLLGATEAMEDSTHLASFLQTLGSAMEETNDKSPVTVNYQCDRQGFFMDGCNAVILWTATTVGAVAEVRNLPDPSLTFPSRVQTNSSDFLQGAPMELTLKGNMRAAFSPASNKLISAEIMFDTGTVAAQLQLLDAPKGELNDEHDICCGDVVAAAAAAAQAAANEADALLDSLQMPQLGSNVPSAINFVSSSSLEEGMSGANTVSDKDDSSDEGFGDMSSNQFESERPGTDVDIANRRSSRRMD